MAHSLSIHPLIVKPYQVTCLAKGGGRGGGGKGVGIGNLEILTIACLTFGLSLTDRTTLGLPEIQIKNCQYL